jgi:regulator of cell morphogenesis and NO signaling
MTNIHNNHIEPNTKLFELIDAHPSVVSIFSRLNITLPFGDISIAEMCERDGHTVELFIVLCRMHIDATYRPDKETLSATMISEIVGYLRASHRYYAQYMLPHVARHLDEILSHCDTLSKRVLSSFYQEYTRYVMSHFEDEESNIFAPIERAEQSCVRDLASLEHPHGDIDDRTNDIASLIIKSLPEVVPTPLRCAMLDDIYALRDDLRTHSNIEMFLLRPIVDSTLKSK